MANLDFIKSELNSAAYVIDGMLKRRFISIEDIIDMFNKPCYEVLSYDREMLKDQKTKMLYIIYLKPFELYYSKYLSEDLIAELIPFAKKRYLQEKGYLDEKMDNNEIKRNDYRQEIEKLQMYYLYSSIYGLSVLRSIDAKTK